MALDDWLGFSSVTPHSQNTKYKIMAFALVEMKTIHQMLSCVFLIA
jgi:hypothetical protein